MSFTHAHYSERSRSYHERKSSLSAKYIQLRGMRKSSPIQMLSDIFFTNLWTKPGTID